MTTYRVESFKVEELWGYRNRDLPFDPDVNFLIGPNASGKTTLLQLLHSIFSGDFRTLREIKFKHIRIGLQSCDGKSKRTVNVESTDDGFEVS